MDRNKKREYIKVAKGMSDKIVKEVEQSTTPVSPEINWRKTTFAMVANFSHLNIPRSEKRRAQRKMYKSMKRSKK